MFDNKLNFKLINLTALVLLLYVLTSSVGLWWGIVARIIHVLAPFIVGFAFAYAFTPLVKWIEKKGVPKSISLIIVIVGIIFIFGSILWITLPMIYDQLSLFVKSIIQIMNDLSTKFDIHLGVYEIKIEDYLNDILKETGSFASSTGIVFVNKSLGFIGKFIIGFVAFIYFLVDMDKIRKSVKEILSSHKKSLQYFNLMDKEITNYLKGLEIFMTIQFFEYSILFLIIGHPNWLILGILACITTIIPYFGGLVTNIIAVLLSSLISMKLMVLTLIICLIFPQVDGYFISPKVYGKTNNVNPLITIMVVSIGGTVANVMGIIVALPVYLLLRTTYHFFKSDLKKGMVIVKRTI